MLILIISMSDSARVIVWALLNILFYAFVERYYFHLYGNP